ncbi:hypothetical protein CC78DRAFT_621701 [Lojkania enalia]|uniref:Uncharacterized protein n=1 Tax=Lojkania enalia TaxID=147567 RepID=A0A9P4JWS4_9PLEO|nr:hypothetical protein CC78DRAFT_621701 [Didymosphaeria enalia]
MYQSSFHETKGQYPLTPNSTVASFKSTLAPKDSKKAAYTGNKKDHHFYSKDLEAANSQHGEFETLEEPHDINHSYYIPLSTYQSPPPSPPPTPREQFHNLRTLLPWILVLILFLITLWHTSIALGAQPLSKPHPQTTPQPINIIINKGGEILTLIPTGTNPAPKIDHGTPKIITPITTRAQPTPSRMVITVTTTVPTGGSNAKRQSLHPFYFLEKLKRGSCCLPDGGLEHGFDGDSSRFIVVTEDDLELKKNDPEHEKQVKDFTIEMKKLVRKNGLDVRAKKVLMEGLNVGLQAVS